MCVPFVSLSPPHLFCSQPSPRVIKIAHSQGGGVAETGRWETADQVVLYWKGSTVYPRAAGKGQIQCWVPPSCRTLFVAVVKVWWRKSTEETHQVTYARALGDKSKGRPK